MSKNINNLPYFKTKQKTEEKIVADFLLRKFRPKIKERSPEHFLVQSIPSKTLNFIKETSKKYPYFLRFDIRLYYPSVNHQVLLEKLPETYHKLSEKPVSRRFKKYLKDNLPELLSQSPYKKGLPIGSRLSWVLAGLFLLDLDLQIPRPFLRQTDDYLIFCKNKKEPEILLKNIILPKLKELNLEINEKKLGSGKFHQDRISFIGFDFYAGYFTVRAEKIEEFKKRVSKITYLTNPIRSRISNGARKKPESAIVKSLNNQILGFGHYYKFASSKIMFEELDGFIRQRFRRWLSRNKDQKQKTANLFLTNQALKNLGLKSLTDILLKYASKKRPISKKTSKKLKKTGHKGKSPNSRILEELEFKYSYKLILNQLKELTRIVNKLAKSMAKIEQKLTE